jgi:hypothetical protein
VRYRDVRHAGLDHDALIVQVDFEDSAHAREHEHDTVLDRQGATRQARARTARHPRHPQFVADADHVTHLPGAGGQHRHLGHHVVAQQPVGLVGAQVVRMGQDVLVPADAPQPGDELCDRVGVDRPLSPGVAVYRRWRST